MNSTDQIVQSSEKEEKILLFNEICNIKDDQKAQTYLQMCEWDVDNAVNTFLAAGDPNAILQNQQNANYINPLNNINPNIINQNPHPGDFMQEFNNLQNLLDNPNLDQYDFINDLLEKNLKVNNGPKFTEKQRDYERVVKNSAIRNKRKPTYNCTRCMQLTFGSTNGCKFHSDLKKTNKDKKPIHVQFGKKFSLQDMVEIQENESQQPQLIYVHQKDLDIDEAVINTILSNQQLGEFMNTNFNCVGVTDSVSEDEKLVYKFSNTNEVPSFMVLYKDSQEKPRVIAKISLDEETTINTQEFREKLDDSLKKFQQHRKSDQEFKQDYYKKKREIDDWIMNTQEKSISVKSTNSKNQNNELEKVVSNSNKDGLKEPLQTEQTDQNLIQSNLLQQNLSTDRVRMETENTNVQPDPFDAMKNIIKDADRKLKEDQDQKYQEMIKLAKEDEVNKIQEEVNQYQIKEQEDKIKQELQDKKKQIQENLKPEPEADSQEPFMTCAFRLPKGEKVQRRFLKSETIQTLHDFIYVIDDIGLEEDDIGFCLMNGYPRVKLTDMNITLEEKFGAKKQDLFIVSSICKDE